MGITALGPRRKITHALSELRKESSAVETCTNSHAPSGTGQQSNNGSDGREGSINGINRTPANKLITDYFPGFATNKKNACSIISGQKDVGKKIPDSLHKGKTAKRNVRNGKLGNVPAWSCIPGTPFRVVSNSNLMNSCLLSVNALFICILFFLIGVGYIGLTWPFSCQSEYYSTDM